MHKQQYHVFRACIGGGSLVATAPMPPCFDSSFPSRVNVVTRKSPTCTIVVATMPRVMVDVRVCCEHGYVQRSEFLFVEMISRCERVRSEPEASER